MVLDEVGVFLEPVAQEVEEGGLDAGEGVVVARDVRGGELEGVGVTFLGEAVDDGASRVAEIHDFRRLVDGFACRVVDGLSQHFHVEVAVQQQYLRVSAGDQEADEGELRHGFSAVDEVAEDMRLQVVDFDDGLAQRLREALGEAHAHHQRAHETWAAGERHGVDVFLADARLTDGAVDHGNDILLVRAACQFRHHATVLFVNFLARNDIAHQRVIPQHRCRRVVAARFYG